MCVSLSLSLSLCVYIYIYMYIGAGREDGALLRGHGRRGRPPLIITIIIIIAMK